MNISKHFTKSGAGNMVPVFCGHGVDFMTRTVRVTLHKPDGHMSHLAMSPAEALDMAQKLADNAHRLLNETAAYPQLNVTMERTK